MRRTLFVLAAVAVVMSACAGGQDDSVTTTISPGTSSTIAEPPSTSLPPSTSAGPPSASTIPPTMIGTGNPALAGLPAIVAFFADLDRQGPGIGVFDPGTGELISVVADEADLGEGSGELAISPDGTSVFYSRILTACASEMVQVNLADGMATRIGPGELPTPSPDGRHLAYVIDPSCRRAYDLVIRDLATGTERIWESELPDDEKELSARIPAMSWSPDSSEIVFELTLEDGTETRIVDVLGQGGALVDSEKLTVDGEVTWSSPLFDTDGSITVLEQCCGADDVARRIVVLGPDGRVAEVLWENVDARGLLGFEPDTEALLVLVDRDDGSTDLVAVRQGIATVVAEHVADAVWRPIVGS